MSAHKDDQIGKSKLTFIDKGYNWGVYVWKKSNGKWFTDGNGSILNIPANKGDLSKISELKQAAAHYGEADGEPVFFSGLSRVSEEEYSEQMERMKEGLLPNMNDLGSVYDAQQTFKQYGDEE